MSGKKHDTILTITVIAIAIATSVVMNGVLGTNTASAETETENVSTSAEITNYTLPTYPWQEYGYTSVIDYHNDLKTKNEEAIGSADEAIETYANVITDEQIETLRNCELQMSTALTLDKYNKYLDEFNSVIDTCEEALVGYFDGQNAQVLSANDDSASYSTSSSVYYEGNGSGLTKSSGVNNHNGRRETYYSSNVLYHYRTSEWTVDSEGFYRDSNGYYIVAASDMAQGTTFEGSKGTCIVRDSGCAGGTTDYYVAW